MLLQILLENNFLAEKIKYYFFFASTLTNFARKKLNIIFSVSNFIYYFSA